MYVCWCRLRVCVCVCEEKEEKLYNTHPYDASLKYNKFRLHSHYLDMFFYTRVMLFVCVCVYGAYLHLCLLNKYRKTHKKRGYLS